MRVLAFLPYRYDTVPGQRFRIEQWERVLREKGVEVRFETFESDELRRVFYASTDRWRQVQAFARCIARQVRCIARLRREWDAVFLFRELLPIGPAWLERWLARKGMPIVYDFDDAIFLAGVSDANRAFAWLKAPRKTGAICRLSAHVTVGNEYLKAYAERFTPNVSVIPTTIDTERYTPKAHVEISGVPVIGWSGSFSTAKHLQTVVPALRRLRRSVAFRLSVIGSPGFRADGLEVTSRPWSAATETEDLKTFDLGIMPLPDDPWARGKCGLKALQYMALGIPTVASPVGVNKTIIQDGRNGFLASTAAEWVATLSRLLVDPALRRRFAEEGRRTVEERYAATGQARRLLDVFQRVVRHVS